MFDKEKECSLILLKIMAYYDFKAETASGGLHPKAEALRDFLINNIDDENELKSFYKRITDNCKYFPNNSELSMIYNNMKILSQGLPEIPYNEKLNLENINSNAKVEDVIKDDAVMSTRSLIEKYGVVLCKRAWFQIGQEMTDKQYDHFIINVRKYR
jgi:hypothetical protein